MSSNKRNELETLNILLCHMIQLKHWASISGSKYSPAEISMEVSPPELPTSGSSIGAPSDDPRKTWGFLGFSVFLSFPMLMTEPNPFLSPINSASLYPHLPLPSHGFLNQAFRFVVCAIWASSYWAQHNNLTFWHDIQDLLGCSPWWPRWSRSFWWFLHQP